MIVAQQRFFGGITKDSKFTGNKVQSFHKKLMTMGYDIVYDDSCGSLCQDSIKNDERMEKRLWITTIV